MPLRLKPAPVAVTDDKVAAVFPPFVSVMVCD